MSATDIARKLRPPVVRLNKDICLVELTWDAKTINEAIDATDCAYVAFTDIRDNSKKHYFNRLLHALKKYPEVPLASGWLRSGKYQLAFQEDLPEETAVVDLKADYSAGILYPEGSICKTSVLRDNNIRFNESLEFYRDELFTIQMSSCCDKRLFVPERRFLPKRPFDEVTKNPERAHFQGWYWELVGPVIESLKTWSGGKIGPAAQYGFLYMLMTCFDCNENASVKMVFEDVPETLRYLDQVGQALRSIDLKVLFGRKRGTKWPNPKLLYLARLRNSEEESKLSVKLNKAGTEANLHYEVAGKRVLVQRFSGTALFVQNLNYVEGKDGAKSLSMHVRFPTCFASSEFELYLSSSYDGEEHDYQLRETAVLSSCRTFFDQKAYDTVLWDVEVPLAPNAQPCKQTISGYAIVQGKRIPLRIAMLDKHTSRVRDDCPEAYWPIPDYLVRATGGRIVLKPATQKEKDKAEQAYCRVLEQGEENEREAARIRKLYFSTQQQFANKRIWVYFDKAFKAGDNAEFVFRHASAQDDGIEHVFYIDPEAADARRMRRDGLRLLEPYSDEGMLYLLNAEVVFATHVPAYRIPGIRDRDIRYYKDLLHAKNIRLYHGFTLTHDCSYSQPFMDSVGVAVSSRYEHELYADPVHGFKEDQILDTGMPRHDGVLHENKRWILFAPSWRPTLRGGVGSHGETLYNPEFVNSRYFQRYNTIFTDERLLDCARRCNYKIKLYLHPRMAPMTVDFKGNDVFEAIDCTQGTEYADIMSKSDLMVTDFSSVMVDFGYARKPVIYYQDPALPYWRYYDFDYRSLGFGEVVETTDQVVELLCEYMENDCALKDEYRKRIDDFFFYDDQNAAKRLYEAVRELAE